MMIMASVVDALCYCEELVFHDGIGEITDAQSLDIATSVLLLRTHQVQELCGMVDLSGADLLREDSLGKRDPKHVKGMNYYAQRRIEMGLEDPYAKLLVAFPLAAHASSHFSLILWLPWTDELFPLDSLVECDHMSLLRDSVVPFINYLTKKAKVRVREGSMLPLYGPVSVCAKDVTDIEQQPSSPHDEANACGFATALFLQQSLRILLDLAHSGGAYSNPMDLSAALSKALHETRVKAPEYNRFRQCATARLVQLAAAYEEAELPRLAEEADNTMAEGTKRVLEAETVVKQAKLTKVGELSDPSSPVSSFVTPH
jgi:hypothetical protein